MRVSSPYYPYLNRRKAIERLKSLGCDKAEIGFSLACGEIISSVTSTVFDSYNTTAVDSLDKTRSRLGIVIPTIRAISTTSYELHQILNFHDLAFRSDGEFIVSQHMRNLLNDDSIIINHLQALGKKPAKQKIGKNGANRPLRETIILWFIGKIMKIMCADKSEIPRLVNDCLSSFKITGRFLRPADDCFEGFYLDELMSLFRAAFWRKGTANGTAQNAIDDLEACGILKRFDVPSRLRRGQSNVGVSLTPYGIHLVRLLAYWCMLNFADLILKGVAGQEISTGRLELGRQVLTLAKQIRDGQASSLLVARTVSTFLLVLERDFSGLLNNLATQLYAPSTPSLGEADILKELRAWPYIAESMRGLHNLDLSNDDKDVLGKTSDRCADKIVCQAGLQLAIFLHELPELARPERIPEMLSTASNGEINRDTKDLRPNLWLKKEAIPLSKPWWGKTDPRTIEGRIRRFNALNFFDFEAVGDDFLVSGTPTLDEAMAFISTSYLSRMQHLCANWRDPYFFDRKGD